jgi:hypothetical protein
LIHHFKSDRWPLGCIGLFVEEFMKASEFCFWLQGYFEISGSTPEEPGAINSQQSAMIQRHLALVFKHDIDPQQGTPEHQSELQSIHDGKPKIGGVGPNGEIYRC